MAGKDRSKEEEKGFAEVLGGVGVAVVSGVGLDLLQPLLQHGTEAVFKAIAKRAEERETLVKIPELYSSDYRVKLEDAKCCLEEVGLRAMVAVVKPDMKYKDYSDLDVVATRPTKNQKVKPGTHVGLKYVTAEVIEASQKLFDESERQKAEDKQRKVEKEAENAEKKAERAEKNKQKREEAVINVRHGFNDAVANTQKGVKGILLKFKKGEDLEGDSDAVDGAGGEGMVHPS